MRPRINGKVKLIATVSKSNCVFTFGRKFVNKPIKTKGFCEISECELIKIKRE